MNGNGKPKPRPIIIKFFDPTTKSDIFKNLKNLKGKSDWKNIFINDDLTNNQAEKMKQLRAINGFARSIGKDSRIRGTSLVVDGVKFSLDEINKIPQEISIEKAKTIEICDGQALAFQGKHSFLSNMAEANFTYNGKDYVSVEQAFHHTKMTVTGNDFEAQKIKENDNPFTAKQISKKLKDTEEWIGKKEKVMKDIVLAKFSQNRDLKVKLLATGQAKLIECTYDKHWGCGVPIAKASQIDPKNMPGKNILGNILVEVRKKLTKK